MPKRVKKPAVRPDLARQWLRRYEEEGYSPPQIAKADGYDVRTVRKQIELARQEREAREARFVVLRQALEKHYGDLVSFAQKLDSEVMSSSLLTEAKNDRLWGALHDHIPRSPLWKGMSRMERLNDEILSIQRRAEERFRSQVENRSSLGFTSKPSQAGFIIEGLIGIMTHHLCLETPWHGDFQVNVAEGGPTEIRYGSWGCALVASDQVEYVKEFVTGLIGEISRWPEYEDMRRVLADRKRVIVAIREELATIILRRLVPGRCKYCPV